MKKYKKNIIYDEKMIPIMVGKKERNSIDFIIDIFIESQASKQVIDERAELVKYSKLKSLANILFEYVIIIFSFLFY